MNKLIKTITFGEYEFDVAINRDIALKVAEEYPDFIAEILSGGKDLERDMATLIKKKQLRKALEINDTTKEGLANAVKFAFPLMLKEAESDLDADTIIQYGIENEADEILYYGLWEVILLGFTNNGVQKTPKIQFKMK